MKFFKNKEGIIDADEVSKLAPIIDAEEDKPIIDADKKQEDKEARFKKNKFNPDSENDIVA